MSGPKRLEFHLEGVHCANCANDLIRGTLLSRAGIIEARYDSKRSLLVIDFDGRIVSENEVGKLVESWGYEISARGAQVPRSRRRYQVMSLLVAATLLALFVWWMRTI